MLFELANAAGVFNVHSLTGTEQHTLSYLDDILAGIFYSI